MIPEDVATRVASSAAFLRWLPVAAVPPILIIDAAASQGGKPITAVSILAAIVGCLPLAPFSAVREFYLSRCG